ncbi:hypothetical protein [Devosia sp.]
MIAADLVAQARAARATVIQHHFADLERDVVSEVRAAGIAVWAWPPITKEEIRFAQDIGVAAPMGDDVRAIMEVIKATSADR